MKIVNGLLDSARQHVSPNFDTRPDLNIDLVVVHGISLPPGEFGGDWIDNFFSNTLDANAHPYFNDIADMRVSSHLLIRRDGEVVQYVNFNQRAWHAGQSSFEGRDCCNDYSIGIELEGTDDIPYEEAQYQQLAEVIGCLRQHYPVITEQRVTGHSDIAPGRKTDPGEAFDWSHLHKLL